MADEIHVDPRVGGASVVKVGGVCYQLVGPSSHPPDVTLVDQAYDSCDDCIASPSSSSTAIPSESSGEPSGSANSASSAIDCNCADYTDLPSAVSLYIPDNTICECIAAEVPITLARGGDLCEYSMTGALFVCDGFSSEQDIFLGLGPDDNGICCWRLEIDGPDYGVVYQNYGGLTGSYAFSAADSSYPEGCSPPASVTVNDNPIP